jgi:methionyl-tRNA synthetase
MLSFAYKRFEGKVPQPDELDDEDRALLEKVEAGFETVGDLYNACKFRAALGEALALAREANVYLDRKAPWFQIKEDRQAAATTVYVILRAVDNLKTILAPILPHTPVLRTGHRSCTSTWGTRGSCSAHSTWSSTRKRPATASCAATPR